MKQLTPAEVHVLLQQDAQVVLLDVREPEEVMRVHLPGAVHIPMAEVPSRLQELDPEAHIVVYCHHGIRSAQVAAFLMQHGFVQVSNLKGGIDAWAVQIDPALPRY